MLLLVSLALKRPARSHSALADRFRRIHFWLTLADLLWELAWVGLIGTAIATGRATLFYVAMVVAGWPGAFFWPLQLFFAATLVAFLIGRPDGSARPSEV